MKREVFKENERVFFMCPYCGEKHTLPTYGWVAYEEREYTCYGCSRKLRIYLNQIGKAYTKEGNCVRYLGYTYKVM